jgi:hypothetical protein
MSAEIIPFDFEEQAVRVVMHDDEPWFVAADVCRVLELVNRHDAVSRLDDDERDAVGITDTIGREQQMTVISESGLYALILTSRKEAARRFRKWITAEVLPAIRRTGRYEHPAAVAPEPGGDIAGLPIREAELWLQMVREARLTQGPRAAVSIWGRSPLPQLLPIPTRGVDLAEARACLAHLLAHDEGGRGVADLAHAARAGEFVAISLLTGLGLRVVADGLFVANAPVPGLAAIYAETRWHGGGHRTALAALPGAVVAGPLSLGGQGTRGVIVPFHLIGGEA